MSCAAFVMLACLLPCSTAGAPGAFEEAGIDSLTAIEAALSDELFDIAVDLLERRLKASTAQAGEYAASLALLARAYHELGRHADIIELVKTRPIDGIEDLDRLAELYYWRAVAHYRLGDDNAVLDLTQAVRLRFPDAVWAPDMLRLRAAALTRANDLAAALDAHEEFAAAYPDDPEAAANRLAWAKALMLDGNPEAGAVKFADLASVDSPLGREASYWLAVIDLEDGRLEEALSRLRDLLDSADITRLESGRAGMAVAAALEVQGDIDAALAALEEAIVRLHPGEERCQARIDASRLMFAAGRFDDAANVLRELIHDVPRRPDVPELQLKLAHGMLRGRQYEQAAAEFQIYLEAFTNRIGQAEALSGLGWSSLALERPAAAAENFERAARLFDSPSRRGEAMSKAADAWFANERFAAALDRYRRAAEFALSAADTNLLVNTRYLAAECMIRLEHFEEAVKALNDLADAFPGHPFTAKALLRIAKLHEERGELMSALEMYENIMQQAPEPAARADSMLSSGMLFYKLFRFDDALESFDRLIEDQPEHEFAERARYMSVWAHSMSGREEKAIEAASMFLEHHPESPLAPEIHFRIAEHEYNRGMLVEAIERFLELVAKYPRSKVADSALLWAGRGKARQQEYSRAIEIFVRLSSDYPDSSRLPEARFSQGDAFSALGEFGEAILLFDEIIERYPDSYLSPAAMGRKGDCLFMLGNTDSRRYREAIDSYRKLLQTEGVPHDMQLQALYKIGRCHDSLGEHDKALEYFYAAAVRFGNMRQQGSRTTPAAVWGFQRAAFDAVAILESRRQWRQAVNMLERVVAADVPATGQAAGWIERLREEHWLLFY